MVSLGPVFHGRKNCLYNELITAIQKKRHDTFAGHTVEERMKVEPINALDVKQDEAQQMPLDAQRICAEYCDS